MKEELDAFEAAYAESKAWVAKEQKALIEAARTDDLDLLEKKVAVFTAEASRRLLEPGTYLMSTEAFLAATFNQQMGFTRFKLSGAAVDGYSSVSAVQAAISLVRNKRAGIIELPKTLKVDPERLEGSIGLVAKRISEGDPRGAAEAYRASQSSIIKHSQIETLIASVRAGSARVEGMRSTTKSDTCDYCVKLAGYWTEDLWTLRHFHTDCNCRIVTRVR